MLKEESRFEPSHVCQTRLYGPPSANTLNSSSSTASGLEQTLKSVPPLSTQSTSPGNCDFSSLKFQEIDTRLHGSISLNDIHDYFVSALLGTLASAFARRTGAIPLTSHSLVLPLNLLSGEVPPDDPTCPGPSTTVATFRIHITTMGALIITLSVSRLDGLRPLGVSSNTSRDIQKAPVLIAPLGLFGSVSVLRDTESPFDTPTVQTPETQTVHFRKLPENKIGEWRQMWTRLLDSLGISASILDRTSWISLHQLRPWPSDPEMDFKISPLPTGYASFVWPAILCFSKALGDSLGGITNCINEMTLGSRAENYDPLGAAQSWLTNAQEREALLSQRDHERKNACISIDTLDVDRKTQHLTSVNSPLLLRRTSGGRADPAVVSAMYPTPPDAIQGITNGVTPGFDGVVSSPANVANPTPMLIDLDATIGCQTSTKDDTPNDLFDMAEKDKTRSGSFFGAEPENLFGDIGDDGFGDTSITDADFDYFDQDDTAADTAALIADLEADIDSENKSIGQYVPQASNRSASAAKAAIEPTASVFAKPELKHARSNLGDTGRPHQTSGISSRVVPVKRQASPFDANTVYKRVRAAVEVTIPSFSSRYRSSMGSVYEKIRFDPSLSQVSHKYSGKGRFDCSQPSEKDQETVPKDAIVDFANGRDKHTSKLSKVALLATSIDRAGNRGASDDDLLSDTTDTDSDEDEPPSPAKSGMPTLKGLDDDRVSIATSLKETEPVDDSSIVPAIDMFVKNGGSSISLKQYFFDHEPFSVHLSLNDDDFITIAQVLTDQAATGTLRYGSCSDLGPEWKATEQNRQLAQATRQSVEALRQVLTRVLGGSSQCHLRNLIEVQDVPLIGQPTRASTGVKDGRLKHNQFFPIGPPHIEVERVGSKLSVLPTAVPFWESLGFGPTYGFKDVSSVCVFPDWEGMVDNVQEFLDRMRSTYESLKLGRFYQVPLSKEGIGKGSDSEADGILAFEVDKISTSTSIQPSPSQTDKMIRLAQAMVTSGLNSRNFVVFFVYSPHNIRSVLEACVAFQQLFRMYRKQLADKHETPQNELVLQLVSLDFIASSSTIIIPKTDELARLALEVYDRCTLFRGPMPAPSILLEKPFSKGIDFKLTTSPSRSLLQENSVLHIAYAQSVDERWVSAAWTDTRGLRQHTASYCLGRKGMVLSSSLVDVLREIWHTSQNIMASSKVHWRVILAKIGAATPQEIAMWQEFSANSNNGVNNPGPGNSSLANHVQTSLILLTVDTNPSLQLLPPPVKVSTHAAAAFYSTPASTPQPNGGAGVRSPEASHRENPLTPGSSTGVHGNPTASTIEITDPGPNSTLVDVSEQSWGCVLAHRLSVQAATAVHTSSTTALVSGYLVKHSGPRIEDPPVVLEVNMLHSDHNGGPRMYEHLMKEVLCHYRSLGSLARARGTTTRRDGRPWHVAAAEKGLRAVYLLM